MKLKESSNYTVELYNPMDVVPAMTIKSNRICIHSPTVRIGTNSPLGFSSTVLMQIDLSTMLLTGKTIIIEEDGMDKFDYASYNNLYHEVYSYMKENNKEIAVFVYYPSGELLRVYTGNTINYYIPTDMPKTTKLTIDGKELYLHRSIFEVIPISLLNKYLKED